MTLLLASAFITACLGMPAQADEFVTGNIDPDVSAMEQEMTETDGYEDVVRYNLVNEYGLSEEELADVDIMDFYLTGGFTEHEYTKEEVREKLEEYKRANPKEDFDIFFGDTADKYEGDLSDALVIGVKRTSGTDSVSLLFDMENGRILKRTQGYWSYQDNRYALSDASKERLLAILNGSGILAGETSVTSGSEGDGTDIGYILVIKTETKVFRYSCLAHSEGSVPENVRDAEAGIRSLMDDIVSMTMQDYIEIETEF